MVLEGNWGHFWLCRICIYSFAFYCISFSKLRSFTQLNTIWNQSNLGIKIGLPVSLIFSNVYDFRPKFKYSHISRRECWEVKIAKIVHFYSTRWRVKGCIKYSKISLWGQLGGKIWGLSYFLTLKLVFPTPSPFQIKLTI